MGAIQEKYTLADVICQHKTDGTIIPLKIRITDEDGEYQVYNIKSYKDVLRRCGQRRAQFFRRGEPLRQSSKILICLFDGHCVNPRFDVYRAGCTSG